MHVFFRLKEGRILSRRERKYFITEKSGFVDNFMSLWLYNNRFSRVVRVQVTNVYSKKTI
jgi:hypothetical protein